MQLYQKLNTVKYVILHCLKSIVVVVVVVVVLLLLIIIIIIIIITITSL